MVGVEESASWGAHVAIAVLLPGSTPVRSPPRGSAAQRRSRRLDKTDIVDSVSVARALLAEPSLGSVQTLEVYDSHRSGARTPQGPGHNPNPAAAPRRRFRSPNSPPRSAISSTPKARSNRNSIASRPSTPLVCRRWPANIGCHGCCPSSTKTAKPAVRSVAWSGSSASSSTSTRLWRARGRGSLDDRRRSPQPHSVWTRLLASYLFGFTRLTQVRQVGGGQRCQG